MDDVATRAVVIGVNIFVTITIVTLVIVMFFQMGEIYGTVANTDTSIYSKFDDVYSMYHGKVESGIGLLNALKKQEDNNDTKVIITYDNADIVRQRLDAYNKTKTAEEQKRESVYLKELMTGKQKISTVNYKYEDRYNVTVEEGENGVLIIRYDRIDK